MSILTTVGRAIALASALLGGTYAAAAADLKIGPDGAALSVGASADLAGKVPDAFKDGTLKIATDPSSPPYTYYQADGQTLIGSDIDLGNAVAAKLGLKAEWSAVKFPGIIAAIEAKRFDTALTGMGDTPAREQKLDFVDYSTDGNAIVVLKGNPLAIKTIADLCGKHVAVLQGSVMQGLVEKQDGKCTDKKIDIQVFQDINQALLQVRTKRADATMYQYGVAAYVIQTSPDAAGLEVLAFEQYGTGYNAMPFRKSDSALRDAVQAALTEMKADGSYDKILTAWGMQANGLEKITVNDGLRFNQPSN
ncbi:ABC transporter substrate-binding protein [Mesorhizobium sp. B4-1-1]|uniref:ABC transporter substrate-binding protein n=1 Tax=Mesorhizobium sp. B4-1-1 TaxID=2589890 RepID=UPI0011266BF3|nr:ABC transporter substrate-binding protein [Mesorhizobium sp. B4-1-1]TPI19389.1 ABC transporter substrate-binding protein [Mesorhizobium sp. B4-1-1]